MVDPHVPHVPILHTVPPQNEWIISLEKVKWFSYFSYCNQLLLPLPFKQRDCLYYFLTQINRYDISIQHTRATLQCSAVQLLATPPTQQSNPNKYEILNFPRGLQKNETKQNKEKEEGKKWKRIKIKSVWACGATSSSSSRTTGFPIDSPLLLSPSLPLSFSLHSFPPVSLCVEYAKPAAAAQKSKVNIASLAYCRRRPLPSPPPLWRLQPFVFVPHSCGHSWCPTKLRSLLVRMFVLVVWLVSCLLLGSSWLGTSCGARSSAFGQLRFCSTRPHTKWQSLLSRRRRQSVAGRGQSSSQSNGPASVRERESEKEAAR